MGILKNINGLRRRLTRGLTKGIHSRANPIIPLESIDIKRILICRPNKRLGNLLMITPLLQEIEATFPGCKVDIFAQGSLAPVVFKNYENVDTIIQLPVKPFKQLIKYVRAWTSIKRNHYDMAINVVSNSSSGRLSTKLANSTYHFFGDIEEEERELVHDDFGHMAKSPVYAFRHYVKAMGLIKNERPVPTLDIKLSAAELAEGKRLLHELVNNDKKTICLFTYATGDKCYPASWWENLYERLKTEYSDCNIIEILSIQKISNISLKAPTFFNKDVRKVGSLIANVQVFIGADGGVMHLASAVNTPTIGLFSVTDPNRYRPYNENSVAIKTNPNDINECIQAVNRILSPA